MSKKKRLDFIHFLFFFWSEYATLILNMDKNNANNYVINTYPMFKKMLNVAKILLNMNNLSHLPVKINVEKEERIL